jgi:hypothetical protein
MKLATIQRKCLYKLVWLSDVRRIDPMDGSSAGPNVHLWQVRAVQKRRVVLSNLSTDHRVELDAQNIKQFDETAPDMPPGATGVFILRSPVILSGCNAFKSLEDYREARRTRPQIFLPVTLTFAYPRLHERRMCFAVPG